MTWSYLWSFRLLRENCAFLRQEELHRGIPGEVIDPKGLLPRNESVVVLWCANFLPWASNFQIKPTEGTQRLANLLLDLSHLMRDVSWAVVSRENGDASYSLKNDWMYFDSSTFLSFLVHELTTARLLRVSPVLQNWMIWFWNDQWIGADLQKFKASYSQILNQSLSPISLKSTDSIMNLLVNFRKNLFRWMGFTLLKNWCCSLWFLHL